MRMFALIATLILLFTYNAFSAELDSAPELPPAVSGLNPGTFNEGRDWELRIRPSHAGYSNYSGVFLGGAADMAMNLGHSRWQWTLGLYVSGATKGGDHFSFSTGPRYNFSDDRARSWFVGANVEFGDSFKCCENNRGFNGQLEVGKRFKINDSWTYAPSVTYSSDGTDNAWLNIRPASFTYSF